LPVQKVRYIDDSLELTGRFIQSNPSCSLR
jgi:hypothetical protein